jgi:hypothetical protein
MTERAALDLSGILTQYAPMRAAEPVQPVLPSDDPKDPLCFGVPVRLGRGPLSWSTSTALVHVGRICHDVNGYYRDLGVEWTATRRELAEAYMAKGGMGSVRLTYVFKQLLNSKTREAYDRTPKGETFPDDYTDEQLRLERKARKAAARRRIQGEAVSVEDVLDEMGYTVLTDDEVDSVSPIGKDQSNRRAEPWEYSYYAWKTSSYLPDVSRLQRWQELLSTAATRYGERPEMIIGTTALSDQPFMLENVNGSPVVFFSEDTPLESSIADTVIESYLRISPHLQPLSAESDIS